MYYNIKLQLIDLLKSLSNLVDVISLNEEKHASFINDCKMVANYLNSSISEYGDIATPVIQLQDIFNMPFNEYKKHQKSIVSLCSLTKNNIMNKIKTRYRMFFMPYKIGMWHSMASIYETALKDPNCDTYVMPLPYSILSYEGEVLGRHCEMAEFSHFNPINYSQINLKEVNPEFIFIHNPYDEINNLTQIDKEYHSYNLKQCTSNLVYTPYFTFFDATDIECDKLILVPGVINSDYVLAQSNKIRDAMISRGISGKKIITMGSPKIDAVVNMKNNPPDLPKEWKDKIDGRKVILYTFTFDRLLNRPVIQGILAWMKSHFRDDDLVFIIRPHPLMLEFSKSRHVNFDLFAEIIKLATNDDRIILDTNSSPLAAYYYSDALLMFGTSSIINEYIATGKPACSDQVWFFSILKQKSYFTDLSCLYYPKKVEEEQMAKERWNTRKYFFDIVKGKNEDIKKQARQKALSDSFLNIDASSGQKIYKKLISTLK